MKIKDDDEKNKRKMEKTIFEALETRGREALQGVVKAKEAESESAKDEIEMITRAPPEVNEDE